MISSSVICVAVTFAVWNYVAIAAPLEDSEMMMMMNENGSREMCLKETLPEKLKMLHDKCMEDNTSETQEDKEILLCILNAEQEVGGEDMDEMSPKMAEHDMSEMTDMMESDNEFDAAMKKCEAADESEDKNTEDVADCILEILNLNCSSMSKEDDTELMTHMEESEETV